MAEKKKLTGLNEFLFPKPPEEFDFRDLMPEYYEYYAEKYTGKREYEELLSALKKMKNVTDPVEKWFLYVTLDKSQSIKFDCDNSSTTCQLAAEIYGKLWEKNALALEYCKKKGTPAGNKKEDTYVGETMNSVWTTLNELGKQNGLGEMSKKKWIDLHENKELQEFFNANPQAVEFIRVAHTIGNFTIWPAGCNGPRGIGPVKDYWDLTLYSIHKWYHDNEELPKLNNDSLFDLFGSQMVNFSNWLAAFGSWDEFVRANYMQPFVEGGGVQYSYETESVPAREDHFGPPKGLWKGHFDAIEGKGEVLPKGDQIEQFFKNATACIKARSKRMVEALQNSPQNQQSK